ncbi:MAG: hypothetical protein ACP5OU_01285 [Methanothrix sp.]
MGLKSRLPNTSIIRHQARLASRPRKRSPSGQAGPPLPTSPQALQLPGPPGSSQQRPKDDGERMTGAAGGGTQ